jgi:hypothetical protein
MVKDVKKHRNARSIVKTQAVRQAIVPFIVLDDKPSSDEAIELGVPSGKPLQTGILVSIDTSHVNLDLG